MPNPTEQQSLEHGPDPIVRGPISLLGSGPRVSSSSSSVSLGAAGRAKGLSHRHRAQQWHLLWRRLCKGLLLPWDQRRENGVAAFLLLNHF